MDIDLESATESAANKGSLQGVSTLPRVAELPGQPPYRSPGRFSKGSPVFLVVPFFILVLAAWQIQGLKLALAAEPARKENLEKMNTQIQTSAVSVEPLFEAVLQYRPEMPSVSTAEGKEGKYLGGGDGTVKGPKIEGKLRWDLYEKGGVVTGEKVCSTQIVDWIETKEGARIQFDSTGFGTVPDASRPGQWNMAAALRLTSEDSRYAWVNDALGVWTGEFSMETRRHHYQAYFHEIK